MALVSSLVADEVLALRGHSVFPVLTSVIDREVTSGARRYHQPIESAIAARNLSRCATFPVAAFAECKSSL